MSLVAVMLAACGLPGTPSDANGGETPPTASVELRFNPNGYDAAFQEVAFRDGDGPWRVLHVVGERLLVEVTDPLGRYGVATVLPSALRSGGIANSTTICLFTLSERPMIDFSGLLLGGGASPPTATATLEVKRLLTDDLVWVGFGAQVQGAIPAEDSVALRLVPGAGDLTIVVPGSSARPSRVLVRRNFTLAAGAAVGDIDFSEALDERSLPLRIVGVTESEPVITMVSFQPSITAPAPSVWSELPIGGRSGPAGSAQLEILPDALSRAGDRYAAGVDIVTENTRRFTEWPLDPSLPSQTVELLPPTNGAFVIDVDGRPSWSFTGAIPDAFTYVSFSAKEAFNASSIGMEVSAGWRRGATDLSLGETLAVPILDASTHLAAEVTGQWLISQDNPRCGGPEVWCHRLEFHDR